MKYLFIIFVSYMASCGPEPQQPIDHTKPAYEWDQIETNTVENSRGIKHHQDVTWCLNEEYISSEDGFSHGYWSSNHTFISAGGFTKIEVSPSSVYIYHSVASKLFPSQKQWKLYHRYYRR